MTPIYGYCDRPRQDQLSAPHLRTAPTGLTGFPFDLRSACDPDYVDPGRTHGDVAEFYDAQGRFMGLAVYMGNGLYVPLPFEE